MPSTCLLYILSIPSHLILLQFYLDNLDDEINIMALQTLVEDLPILFQACNEGVVNVLGD